VFVIICGHRFVVARFTALVNVEEYNDWFNQPYSTLYSSHGVAFDTFFFIGGLNFVWITMPKLER
jgi:hypothetical protein